MAIDIKGAKVGMLVVGVPSNPIENTISFYRDSKRTKFLKAFEKGKHLGKIIKVSEDDNLVQIAFPTKVKVGILRFSTGWCNPQNLGVNGIQVALPTNIAELKEKYVISGRTNINVRRSPINGTPFAKVTANQMVRVTGKTKSGYTEVVTDNGNGWIASRYLTDKVPSKVTNLPNPNPQPQQDGTTNPDPGGIIYTPTEKLDNTQGNLINAALIFGAIYAAVKLIPKLFKSKTVL
jgi:hypothetical protein